MKVVIEIETYYLIDYENVCSAGISGCNKLNKSDHIIIFFTSNAKKLDMSKTANHGEAELKMIEVPSGKQAAHLHIVSYLGYLVGADNGKYCSIIIISNEMDFDSIIKLWKKERSKVKISRTHQIQLTNGI